MGEQNGTIVKKCLDRVELSNKPTLFLTEEFKRKIDFLHKKAGATEWSGELITKEEGSITDPDNWKITAVDIFLVDVGSPGYTSYEVDKGSFKSADIIELYEQFPELEEGEFKLHSIHSHHSMQCFFSGTDWENLEDRACVSNYFLMLIVNFDGKYCAKVAYKGIQKGYEGVKLEFANNADGLKPLELKGKKDRDVLVVMDCKIEIESVEIDVDTRFKDRYEAVAELQKKEAEEEAKRKKEAYKGKGVQGYRGKEHGTWRNGAFHPDAWSGRGWGQGMLGLGEYGDGWSDMDIYEDIEDPDYYWAHEKGVWVKKKKEKKEKKISEMTEKEWNSSQQIEKFDIRHAKAFLNSVLYGTYMPTNFNDCISKIESDKKKLDSDLSFEVYIEDFEEMLQEHFDVIWPKGTVEQYGELLRCVIEYLRPYKYNRLVHEMIECVEQEIKLSLNVM